MEVLYGTPEDLDAWMRLVRKVSWNFPGLETPESIAEHERTVLKFIRDRRAVCVKAADEIVGVLLFSRKQNMICCLAVDPDHRRQGIAAALLEKALSDLDRSRDITVSTFRADDEKGAAPRALYQKFGFEPGRYTIEFDYPNQEFVLHPSVETKS